MFTVLVTGSRTWTDVDVVRDALVALDFEHQPGIHVIHGGAAGADRIAAMVCLGLSIATTEYPADWKKLGKRAGFVRNEQMLDTRPDLVLAFQRASSRGTQHTIDGAKRRGIPGRLWTRP